MKNILSTKEILDNFYKLEQKQGKTVSKIKGNFKKYDGG